MEEDYHNEGLLLSKLRKGDAQAFEYIFRRYWKSLYAVAKSKVQSHDEAEEIIQAIFSSLWEKRSELMITDLSSYLKAAVKNRVLNIIRANITKEKYWRHYRQFIPQQEEATENYIQFDELDSALREAVNSLPEKSRQVFTLSRVEGRSNAEIANMLALSEKAIEYHLTKSLKNLKLRLKDYIA
jgi:RNA polymerase sigma-70 factor (ECF subfamily)